MKTGNSTPEITIEVDSDGNGVPQGRVKISDLYDYKWETRFVFNEENPGEYVTPESVKMDLGKVFDDAVTTLIFRFDFQYWLKDNGYLVSGKCTRCGLDKGLISDNVIDIEVHYRVEHQEYYPAFLLAKKL